jgi:uncharacterized protein YabN with tetrapyrrole methylase and pyrophosphatase domain
VLAKVREELEELGQAVKLAHSEGDQARLREELGDVLFSIANVARHLGLDPEAALQASNQKFMQRFTAMEALAEAAGQNLGSLRPEQMEELWQQVKSQEEQNR